MGVIRIDPNLEKKLKRIHLKVQMQYPKKRITIVNITSNIDFNEDELVNRIIEQQKKRRRGNRYFY